MPGLSGSRWAATSGIPHRRTTGGAIGGINATQDHPRTIETPDAQLDDVQLGVSDGNTLPPPPHFVRASSEPRNMAGSSIDGQAVASPAAELNRYKKIVRRLKWKLPYLASGYRQATARVGPDVDREAVAEAELMFKLDFFEFYMLIERALVHLQGVFGIVISRLAPAAGHPDSSLLQPLSRHHPGGSSTHRYHANVLSALDHESNPLHPILGTGDVRRQLGRAKDLRNRWKNADDGLGEELRNGKMPGPLESYDLENILDTIFQELDRAFLVAEQHVLAQVATEMAVSANEHEQGSEDETQWGFITDAMDWSSV